MSRKSKRANNRALAKRQEALAGQPRGRSFATQRSRFVVAGVLSAFVLLFCLLAITGFQQKTPTVDEPAHLLSGYSILKWGDYRANPEHPPLAKVWAALPLLFLDINNPQPPAPYWDLIPSTGTLALHTVNAAVEMLFVENDAERLFFYAKLMMVAVGLVLGLFVFRWSKDLFGMGGAIAALGFYTFDPNILAHSTLVHTDIPFTAVFFIGSYFFWRALQRLDVADLSLAALCLGLAVITKWAYTVMLFTWVVFLVWRIFSPAPLVGSVLGAKAIQNRWRKAGILFGLLACMVMIGYVFVWTAYGFHYLAVPDGVTRLPMEQQLANSHFARPLVEFFTRTHLFPEAWIYGQLDIFQQLGRDTYLLGENRIGAGFWLYFPLAFMVKTPLPTVVILIATLALWFYERDKKPAGIFLLVPVTVYFSLAVWSRMNIGLRHVLPIYPFLFVFAGGTAAKLWQSQSKVLRGAPLVAGIWLALSTLIAWPNYLSFFNELIGGSRNGYKVLLDSNVDWGQDLKGLKRWMDDHGVPRVQFLYFGIYNAAVPRYYGINAIFLPGSWVGTHDLARDNPALPNYLALSVNHLYGFFRRTGDEEFVKPFRKLQPVAKIGQSIWIYKMDQAIEQFREMVRANPSSSESQYYLANLLSHQGMIDEALEHYQRVVEIEPEFAVAHNNFANALAKVNRIEEAVVHWRKVLELPALNNRYETLFRLGTTLAKYGQLADAEKLLQEVTKAQPGFMPAYHSLGIVFAAQGRLDRSVEYFRKAVQIDPQFAEAHVALARALAEQGKPNEAAFEFQEAKRILKSGQGS
jgi:tetratricopeptide (TPR) repeat protein